MKRIILGLLLCLSARQVSAGDAIAMGFNIDGVWTAVTYFRSLTPKNGDHYWTAAEHASLPSGICASEEAKIWRGQK